MLGYWADGQQFQHKQAVQITFKLVLSVLMGFIIKCHYFIKNSILYLRKDKALWD